RWWSRTGLIGRLLDVAASDRRSEVDAVAEALRKLAKREDLAELLMREDAQLRTANGRPLEGRARRKLLEQARASLEAIRAWVESVRVNRAADQHRHPVPAA